MAREIFSPLDLWESRLSERVSGLRSLGTALLMLGSLWGIHGCAAGGNVHDLGFLSDPRRALPSFCAPTNAEVCVIHCAPRVTHIVFNLSVLKGYDTYDRRSLCRDLR